ncbi:MAG: HAD-IA family hydrolase [Synechococcus sp. ELA057]
MRTQPPGPLAGAGPLRALLWDVDGTLAETELDGHRQAFNRAFAEEGLPWQWDQATYRQLLAISGGRERMRSFLRRYEGEEPDPARLEQLQTRKQAHYGDLMRSGALPLRPGVARLIREAAAAGLTQAIVTTSGRTAVEALCQGMEPDLRDAFDFWICGEDVSRKKPDPEAYLQAIERLGCHRRHILAMEDSGNGLRAATGANLACLVTLSLSSQHEFSGLDPAQQDSPRAADFSTALAVLDGLGEVDEGPTLLRGKGCLRGPVTLSWLQDLAAGP